MGEPARDSKTTSVSLPPVELINSSDSDCTPADDLAWVDSCLFGLAEAPVLDWSSFKVSLSEIHNVPPEPFGLLVADNDDNDHMEIGDIQPFPSSESNTAAFSTLINDQSDFAVESEDNAVHYAKHWKKKEFLKRKIVLENAWLPDHSTFLKAEDSDFGTGLGSSALEVATSSNGIFKVWDLGVSDEHDGFTRELNTALDQSMIVDSTSDLAEGLTIELLDDTVAGFSNLSLSQSSK